MLINLRVSRKVSTVVTKFIRVLFFVVAGKKKNLGHWPAHSCFELQLYDFERAETGCHVRNKGLQVLFCDSKALIRKKIEHTDCMAFA